MNQKRQELIEGFIELQLALIPLGLKQEELLNRKQVESLLICLEEAIEKAKIKINNT